MTPFRDAESEKLYAWNVLVAVALVYFMACFTPAVCIDSGGPASSDLDLRLGSPMGLILLLFGWAEGIGMLPWSANPVFLVALGLFAFRYYRLSLLASSLAALLGLTTWTLNVGEGWLIGCYLWEGSMILLVVSSALACRVPKTQPAR